MYAFVDIKTTGQQLDRDRIVEISILLYDGSRVETNYNTYINPGFEPAYETYQLTTVHPGTLRSAPKFYQVAKEMIGLLQNRVLISFGARYTYSFLKKEFKDLGFLFQSKVLCLERLAHERHPHLEAHSLQRLARETLYSSQVGHRCTEKANLYVHLFSKWVTSQQAKKPIAPEGAKAKATKVPKHYLDSSMAASLLPVALSKSQFSSLPDAPGVYFFHDSAGNVIYVGKSISIRKRVTSHFQIDLKSPKAHTFKQAIADISHETTGSELTALLYESYLIKEHNPAYNHSQKRQFYGYCLDSYKDAKGYLNLKIERLAKASNPHLPVSSLMGGKGLLYNLVEKYQLCQKHCGLYKTKQHCFDFVLKKCSGACIGKESSIDYNQRVEAALARFKYPHENFFILGQGKGADELSVILVEDGHYQGFGYIDHVYATSQADLRSCIKPYPDTKDVQQIIRSYLPKIAKAQLILF